jgi:hypothetical protein
LEKESLEAFGKIARDLFYKCSLVIADGRNQSDGVLVQVTEVSEKMKNSFLVLLFSEVNSPLNHVTFKTKALIITGNSSQIY